MPLNLRQYGNILFFPEFIFNLYLAAPKGTPMKTNQNQKSQRNLPQKRPRSNQKRRKRSPPKSQPPKLSRIQRLEKRNLKRKEMETERPHPTPPTNPPSPTPTPAPTTNSAQLSNEEKVRKMWSNLDFDFAYSGNANDILNKIKSYRFVQLFGSHFIFIQCSSPNSKEF